MSCGPTETFFGNKVAGIVGETYKIGPDAGAAAVAMRQLPVMHGGNSFYIGQRVEVNSGEGWKPGTVFDIKDSGYGLLIKVKQDAYPGDVASSFPQRLVRPLIIDNKGPTAGGSRKSRKQNGGCGCMMAGLLPKKTVKGGKSRRGGKRSGTSKRQRGGYGGCSGQPTMLKALGIMGGGKQRGGTYKPTAKNRSALRKFRAGKSIGFTMRSSLKAKGLIPRANGTRRVSNKYK